MPAIASSTTARMARCYLILDGTGNTAAGQLATLTGAPAIINSNIVLA